jgi:hypothetical protein
MWAARRNIRYASATHLLPFCYTSFTHQAWVVCLHVYRLIFLYRYIKSAVKWWWWWWWWIKYKMGHCVVTIVICNILNACSEQQTAPVRNVTGHGFCFFADGTFTNWPRKNIYHGVNLLTFAIVHVSQFGPFHRQQHVTLYTCSSILALMPLK